MIKRLITTLARISHAFAHGAPACCRLTSSERPKPAPCRRSGLWRFRAGCGLAVALTSLCVLNLSAADELERGFNRPPDSARPWVYWFWLNGNITSNGITADLEAMKRVGIGGVLIMEVDQGAPVGPVDFMGQRWRDMFKHVVGEARRLGLEVNLNNDAGWNGSGGPWIKPEQSMQKVVWTETNLAGPNHFEGILAQPETVAGFYKDISVQAFPAPGAHRIAGIRQKALFETGYVGEPAAESLPAEMVIDRSKVIELTARMGADGRLQWDVPEGHWTVLRLGHTSTGVQNAPAPATGRGLECDKLSKAGIEANFAGMMAKVVGDIGIMGGTTPLTPSLSPSDGERVPVRAGEGTWRAGGDAH